MKTLLAAALAAALGLSVLRAADAAVPADWRPPAAADRCPSKWGAADQRGSVNQQTAAAVLKAAKLIRTGEAIELGHVLRSTMPISSTRGFELHTKRTVMNPTPDQRGSNEELVVAELGQIGTQLDGFAHQTIGGHLYNCFDLEASSARTGFTKLGIEGVGQIFTRGVLIDVAALKGVDMLPDDYEISVDDLQRALARQRLALQAGDAVLIHTGWGNLWEKDNARYARSCPGLGVAAAEWLLRQDPMLIGLDNDRIDVAPSRTPGAGLPVHQLALVARGVHLLENLKLDELAASGAHEFAFIMQPLKLQGATGSTVAPVAIH